MGCVSLFVRRASFSPNPSANFVGGERGRAKACFLLQARAWSFMFAPSASWKWITAWLYRIVMNTYHSALDRRKRLSSGPNAPLALDLALRLPDALGFQNAPEGLSTPIGDIPNLIGAISMFIGEVVLARLVGQATQAFAAGVGLEVARGLGQAVRCFCVHSDVCHSRRSARLQGRVSWRRGGQSTCRICRCTGSDRFAPFCSSDGW